MCAVIFTNVNSYCTLGLDPCRSSPCENNGVCKSQNGTDYTCTCVDNWDGINCAYRYQDGALVNSSYMYMVNHITALFRLMT